MSATKYRTSKDKCDTVFGGMFADTPAGHHLANGLAFTMHMCPYYPYPRVLKAIDVGCSGLQMYNPEDGKVFSFQFDEFDMRFRGAYDVDFRTQEPK